MQFSVVGLPHYTIWHLYEPSVDDIRHMEEMEQERLAKEAEEKARAEREKKIKDAFDDTNTQWEQDKSEMQKIAKEAKKEAKESTEKSNSGSSRDSKADSKQEEAMDSKKTPERKGLADA